NLFVAYPSWRNSDGEYKDVCFPMTKDMREDITVAVLAKYEEI
nr:SpoVG family protein [Lachnospiraceae bacterium]